MENVTVKFTIESDYSTPIDCRAKVLVWPVPCDDEGGTELRCKVLELDADTMGGGELSGRLDRIAEEEAKELAIEAYVRGRRA